MPRVDGVLDAEYEITVDKVGELTQRREDFTEIFR